MDDDDVDRILKSALGRPPARLPAPGNADEHPSVGDIAELRSGSLPASRSHEVTVHLDRCPRCARTFLDFDVPPPLDAADENFDENAGWERLRLGNNGPEGPTSPTATSVVAYPSARPRERRWWPQRWSQVVLPVAATLLAGLGLPHYLGDATGETPGSALQPHKALTPRGDPADRRPVATSRIGAATLQAVLEVGRNQGDTALQYDVQLVRAGADPHMPLRRWNQLFSEPGADIIVVPIPRRLLTVGDYELHVRKATDVATESPAVYRFVVHGPADR